MPGPDPEALIAASSEAGNDSAAEAVQGIVQVWAGVGGRTATRAGQPLRYPLLLEGLCLGNRLTGSGPIILRGSNQPATFFPTPTPPPSLTIVFPAA